LVAVDVRLRVFFLACALSACGSSSNAPATTGELVCNAVDAGASCATDGPTFESLQPVFARACNPCHDGTTPDGPWPLVNYDDVASWSSLIKSDILNCSMPPSDGGIPITDHERNAIVNWVLCDVPP
jgi:cytochrome c5